MKEMLLLNGRDLTIDQLYRVAHQMLSVSIAPAAKCEMDRSRAFIEEIVKNGQPVYGINTGFGALSEMRIKDEDLENLQLNLIRSHCTGVGRAFNLPVTRAIMLLRSNCLVSGHSGITPKIVELLVEFINRDIVPVVPQKGSVGASGDLAPLSHIALCLIGEGEVNYKGKIVRSDFAIEQEGLRPAQLGPKDGLALINGTAVMGALGALAAHEARNLMKVADVAGCLTLEAVRGTKKAFDPKISKLKPHPGQLACSRNLNRILTESEVMSSHGECGKVQDPYSLRCIPQVHGACRQTLNHAWEVLSAELNAVTDNPLVFPQEREIISGGNFHGEALALCMDYLAMGLAELCNISERRIEKMMNPVFSDLPPFLVKDSGLNSGFMIAHVTAAALASENKYLCHPASIDSVPTSTDKEDHVSMGVTSGRKLWEVLDNLKHCLAIEIMCAAQALEFLRPRKPSRPLEVARDLIRAHVAPLDKDRVLSKDIQRVVGLIENDEIVRAVEDSIGELE